MKRCAQQSAEGIRRLKEAVDAKAAQRELEKQESQHRAKQEEAEAKASQRKLKQRAKQIKDEARSKARQPELRPLVPESATMKLLKNRKKRRAGTTWACRCLIATVTSRGGETETQLQDPPPPTAMRCSARFAYTLKRRLDRERSGQRRKDHQTRKSERGNLRWEL